MPPNTNINHNYPLKRMSQVLKAMYQDEQYYVSKSENRYEDENL